MSVGDLIMRAAIYGMLFAVIANGCTTVNILNQRLADLSYIDSAIKPYSNSFVTEAVKRGNVAPDLSKLTMVFGKTSTKDEPNTIGTCSGINGYPIITIDTNYWDVADEFEKQELIYHELGHCILNRDHCEVKENGKPVSLMEPEMVGSSFYQENREKLINELFDSNDGCGQIGSNSDGVHLRIRE